MISGATDVNFHHNGLRIQVKSAPAQLCTQCDHKTLDGKIALYIDHIVQAIFASPIVMPHA